MPSSQWKAEGAPTDANRLPRLLATDWLQSPPVVRSSVLAVRGFPLARSLHSNQGFCVAMYKLHMSRQAEYDAVQPTKCNRYVSVRQLNSKIQFNSMINDHVTISRITQSKVICTPLLMRHDPYSDAWQYLLHLFLNIACSEKRKDTRTQPHILLLLQTIRVIHERLEGARVLTFIACN